MGYATMLRRNITDKAACPCSASRSFSDRWLPISLQLQNVQKQYKHDIRRSALDVRLGGNRDIAKAEQVMRAHPQAARKQRSRPYKRQWILQQLVCVGLIVGAKHVFEKWRRPLVDAHQLQTRRRTEQPGRQPADCQQRQAQRARNDSKEHQSIGAAMAGRRMIGRDLHSGATIHWRNPERQRPRIRNNVGDIVHRSDARRSCRDLSIGRTMKAFTTRWRNSSGSLRRSCAKGSMSLSKELRHGNVNSHSTFSTSTATRVSC
jgi:hypothetical protein